MIAQPLRRWGRRLWEGLWQPRVEEMPRPQRWLVIFARLLFVLVRDIFDGQITMRAMGLVYTTLLSLVPLLALAFSLFKAFGIHNALEPMLREFLAPLGADADQIVVVVVGFVENIDVGVLGALGLALLIYGVISLIQKVEAGCNYIWQVRQPRSLARRFSEYLSVLLVGPLVLVTAASMTASVTNNWAVQWLAQVEPFGTTLLLLGTLLPYFLYAAAFTFLFMFMPNTKVRLWPAIAGGLFAGVLWQTASLMFAVFAGRASNVNAIYSSFAILVFLLVWLYISWLIMLLGCRVAFLLQHPEQLQRERTPPQPGAEREESLALLIMALVAHNYIEGQPPWRVDRLARYLRAVPMHVYAVVDRLLAAKLLLATADSGGGIVPHYDIDRLSVDEVLKAVRTGVVDGAPHPRHDAPHRHVQAVLQDLERARRDALGDMTVRELAHGRRQHRVEATLLPAGAAATGAAPDLSQEPTPQGDSHEQP